MSLAWEMALSSCSFLVVVLSVLSFLRTCTFVPLSRVYNYSYIYGMAIVYDSLKGHVWMLPDMSLLDCGFLPLLQGRDLFSHNCRSRAMQRAAFAHALPSPTHPSALLQRLHHLCASLPNISSLTSRSQQFEVREENWHAVNITTWHNVEYCFCSESFGV